MVTANESDIFGVWQSCNRLLSRWKADFVMHRYNHMGLMLVLGAIWGASFLFMRVASPEFGPIALIQFRVLVASCFLLGCVFFQGAAKELLSAPGRMLIVGLLGSAIPFTLFAFGTLTLSAGLSSVLNATTPFFGAFIAMVLLGESISPIKWLGLLVGFSGVCALVWDKLQVQGGAVAISACLLAAFLYAVAAHYSKRKLGHLPPMVVATGSQIMASLWMIPVTIWFLPSKLPSVKSWLAALSLGVLCTGVALAIYFTMLKSIEATRIMTIAYLIPLFGILWGVVFLNESLTVSTGVGGCLVFGGLYLFNRPNR
jgi:drug/metabolite transporter (DMT)-like permease